MTVRQENCVNNFREEIDSSLETRELPLKIDHLKRAINILKVLKGEFYDEEEVYDRIFKNFCIGK